MFPDGVDARSVWIHACNGELQSSSPIRNAAGIEELLAEFKERHEALHREWTAAVGTHGYIKAPWRDRDNALVREYRDKLTALGYPGTSPLLPNGAR